MDLDELLEYVASALEAEHIPYAVTGSMASIFYGDARLTADIDIVVDLKPAQVASLRRYFPEADYCFSEEAAHLAIGHGRMFNVIHSASGLKVDLIVAGPDPLNFGVLARVRALTIRPGVQVRMSSPEDVIISKLRSYQEGESEKHLRDIRGILESPDLSLDLAYIEQWVRRWGMDALWRKLLEATRPGPTDAPS